MNNQILNNAAAFYSHQLVTMLAGGWISQAVTVVARLGIADVLTEGPHTIEAIAEKTGTHTQSLYRVMRALASVDVFIERDDRHFELTPKAAFLRTDHPQSLRAYALMMGNEWIWNSWAALETSVKTGEPAFEHVYGSPLFEYYKKNPEAGRSSSEGLRSRGQQEDEAVLRSYDFSFAKSVVDVGGGKAGLLKHIIATYPTMRGTLFDIPHVVDFAKSARHDGISARLEFIAGDFFTAVPSGRDLYVMKKVLHDWDDEQCIAILRNCRAAMPDHGRILIIDQVVPMGNGPSYAKLLDLLMLVLSGGRERTEQEHAGMLTAAGLRLARVIPLMSSLCIVEAVPA